MDAIEIRAATPDDADAVASYHDRCFTNTYSSQLLAGELETPDLEGTREPLHDWFLPESEFETRVAVVGGAPIGHFTVSGHQLVHLFAEPDHQGMGLGRHLLAQGEAMIAAGGHTDFELHARVDNLAAVAIQTGGRARVPIGNQPGDRIVKRCMQRVRWGVAVLALALVACGGTRDTGEDAAATARLEITALAGPVCPVETDPPSPECAPQPVESATIIVTDADGDEVARGTTGSDGVVGFDVAPGELTVVPQPVEGLLGTASTISARLTAGQTLRVTVDYDTGIR
jgi:GNAT superfamily N-acetyltransferase